MIRLNGTWYVTVVTLKCMVLCLMRSSDLLLDEIQGGKKIRWLTLSSTSYQLKILAGWLHQRLVDYRLSFATQIPVNFLLRPPGLISQLSITPLMEHGALEGSKFRNSNSRPNVGFLALTISPLAHQWWTVVSLSHRKVHFSDTSRCKMIYIPSDWTGISNQSAEK